MPSNLLILEEVLDDSVVALHERTFLPNSAAVVGFQIVKGS
jgi:hypothetical protein